MEARLMANTPDQISWGKISFDAEADAGNALLSSPRPGDDRHSGSLTEIIRDCAEAMTRLQFRTWNFGDSVAFEALLELSEVTGDEQWARFAHGWGRAWASRSLPFVRLDCTIPGAALVRIARRYDDQILLEALIDVADYLRARRVIGGAFETWLSSPLIEPYGVVDLAADDAVLLANPPAGVFLDCLHFDPPFFAELGVATNNRELFELGVTQAEAYVSLLQQEDGLFDHFVLEGATESFGPGWGRGQGWALLGLLEVIDCAEKSAFRGAVAQRIDLLRTSADELMAAMVRLQRDDGHWWAVVNRPESGDEYSTAGFMAHGFSKALKIGFKTAGLENSFAKAAEAVLLGLDSRGQLREVSAAVYASTVPEHYFHVPRGYVVPWGQGPALLALLASAE